MMATFDEFRAIVGGTSSTPEVDWGNLLQSFLYVLMTFKDSRPGA